MNTSEYMDTNSCCVYNLCVLCWFGDVQTSKPHYLTDVVVLNYVVRCRVSVYELANARSSFVVDYRFRLCCHCVLLTNVVALLCVGIMISTHDSRECS